LARALWLRGSNRQSVRSGAGLLAREKLASNAGQRPRIDVPSRVGNPTNRYKTFWPERGRKLARQEWQDEFAWLVWVQVIFSPDASDTVGIQFGIGANHRNVISKCLGDHQSIEGVVMACNERQLRDLRHVLWLDWKNSESIVNDGMLNQFVERFVQHV